MGTSESKGLSRITKIAEGYPLNIHYLCKIVDSLDIYFILLEKE